jgi:hypothetical protein
MVRERLAPPLLLRLLLYDIRGFVHHHLRSTNRDQWVVLLVELGGVWVIMIY